MTYVNGGWTPAEEEDGDQDLIGDNPTGRKRKSSASTRRKKDRRLFKGTPWEKK